MKPAVIALIILFALSFGTIAYAQLPTPSITVADLALDQIPSDVNVTNPAGPADFVQKLFSFAIYIAGTLAVIMIVYGGVQYILNAGNESALKEAKDVILGAVWGIALLAGGWVILNTINPQLVSLSNLGLENVALHGNTTTLQAPQGQTATGGFGGTKIGCTLENLGGDLFLAGVPGSTVKDQLAYLAEQLLNSGINLSQGPSTCESAVGSGAKKDNAWQNVKDVSEGRLPVVCEWNSGDGYNGEGSGTEKFKQTCANVCQPGGKSQKTTLCPSLLIGLKALYDKVKNGQVQGVSGFTVGSITGYLHSLGSPHFGGKGVDISPSGTSQQVWNNLVSAVNGLSDYGNGFYEGSGTYQQTTGDHVHINYKGAGSSSNQQAIDELARIKAVAQQLDLGKFKGDMSFGWPVATSTAEFQCSDRSSPRSIIEDSRVISANKLPKVCDESVIGFMAHVPFETVFEADIFGVKCACKYGGKEGQSWVKEQTLQKLLDLQGTGIDYKVLALTGGVHIGHGTNILGESHYSGLAFDIVPMSNGSISTSRSDWIALRNEVRDVGDIGGDVKFVVDKITETGSYFVTGMSWIEEMTTLQNEVTDDNLLSHIYIPGQSGGCPMFKNDLADSTYLYDVFDVQNKKFKRNENIEEDRCYNLRIRWVLR